MRDFVKIAHDYATDVLAGRILACEFIKLACQRFLDDQKRRDLVMKPKKVAAICLFIEKLRHIKGKWAGKTISLESWQIFILCNIFGWYYAKTGKRRFRDVYLEVPRKNAKSTLTSGVGLFMLSLEGEGGAEVYSAATTRDQAKIVFLDAKRMVDKDEEVREMTGISTSAHTIVHEDSSSVFRPLSADANTLDGLNVYSALIDEYHKHPNASVLEVLETGMGARENPLLWVITTSGDDIGSACYDRRDFSINVLRKVVVDEKSDTYFTMIYTIDEGDDWKAESTWRKANPNYGVSVNPDDLLLKARHAESNPSKKAAFLTKHLDVWVSSSKAWLDIARWSACRLEGFDPFEYTPDPVWIGLDLASRRDIAAMQVLARRDSRLFTWGKYYIPRARLEDEGNAMYRSWADQGFLTVTDGDIIDFNRIEDDLLEVCRDYDVQGVAFDPYQATKLMTEISDKGVTCVEVKQSYAMLSEPMTELEADIISEGIEHDGNPVMAWMMSNVVERKNGEYRRPDKESAHKKVDGAVALIMAKALAMRDDINGLGSVYDQRKSLFL